MPIASRLTSTGTSLINGEFKSSGTLLVNGTFDENIPIGSLDFSDPSPVIGIQGANAFAFGTNNFTIESWVYTRITSSNRLIYDSRPDGGSTEYPLVRLNASNQLTFGVGGSTGGFAFINGTTSFAANTWYHVAVTRQSNVVRLFVNGIQEASATFANTLLNGGSGSTGFAGRPMIGVSGFTYGNNPWQGLLTGMRVINGTAAYTANFTVPTTTLPPISDTVLLINCEGTNLFKDTGPNNYSLVSIGVTANTINPYPILPNLRIASDKIYANQFDESTFSNLSAALASTRNTINQLTADTNGLNNFAQFATKQAAQGGEVANIAPPDSSRGNVAYMYITTATNVIHNIIRSTSIATTFHPLTYSAYMKGEGTIRYMQFIIDDTFNAGIVANFDLLTGAVTTFVNTTGVVLAATMINVGNGWWRCSLSGNVGATASRITMISSNSGTAAWYPNSLFNIGDKVYIWGMQLEYNKIGPSIIYQPRDISGRGYATFARSENRNGDMYLSDIFDEFTGAPVVDPSLQLWLDAGQTSSYPGAGSTWTDLSGNGRDGGLVNTAAITFIGASSAGGTSSVVATVPAGTLNGHLMIMMVSNTNTSATWTTPAGWTLARSTSRSIFWRIASSEPASYTVSASSSTTHAFIVVYANATFDTAGGAGVDQPPAITVANPGSTVIYWNTNTTGSITWATPPSGYAARISDSDANGPSGAVWDRGSIESGSYQAPTTTGSGGTTLSSAISLVPTNSSSSYFNPTFGGSIIFDGTDDFVQCSGSITVTAATFVSWIRRNGSQNQYDGIIYSRGTNISGMGFGSSNQIGYTWNDAINTYTWNSGLTVPDLTWCMIAVSVTSTAATAYLCQSSGITSATNTVSHTSTTLDDIKIAQDDSGGRFFNGAISSAMIYNRALSADEIQTNFNALRGRYGI